MADDQETPRPEKHGVQPAKPSDRPGTPDPEPPPGGRRSISGDLSAEVALVRRIEGRAGFDTIVKLVRTRTGADQVLVWRHFAGDGTPLEHPDLVLPAEQVGALIEALEELRAARAQDIHVEFEGEP